METGGIIGIIYGIILLIIGALGVYSPADYLNEYTAYLLVILGIISLIAGAYFGRKK